MKRSIIFLLLLISSVAVAQVHKGFSTREMAAARSRVAGRLGRYPKMFDEYYAESNVRVKLERVACYEGRVNLYFNEWLKRVSMREDIISKWEQMVRDTLGEEYSDAKVGLFCGSTPLERYVPNLFRRRLSGDDSRRMIAKEATAPLVRNLDYAAASEGLANDHIALWPSHGYYYDNGDTVWQFQRPALFGTFEDLHTYIYIDQYLAPMLERAGAVVVMPRERDTNPREIIIDDDGSVLYSEGKWSHHLGGYGACDSLSGDFDNPFRKGGYVASPAEGGWARYRTAIDSAGRYAVCVSYHASPKSSDRVQYMVKDRNGEHYFEVNQQIGGGWVYLAHFDFDASAEIYVEAESQFTTDAVKIGGGMGNVVRGGKLSGAPRWAEAARYYMQYSGVNPKYFKIKHQTKSESDYMDDYKSRGEWVNYMRDSLGVPVDIAVALHSNAGITDSIFGTLTVHATSGERGRYDDGVSRFAARDFADVVQTQVVDDLRARHDSCWVRKSMYDAAYSEAFRGDLPSIIIEMFSHQNMGDMRYALVPEFRFTLARAIYKGIVRYLADSYSRPYQIAPLPPVNFVAEYIAGHLRFEWQEQVDSLEADAASDYYAILGDTTSHRVYVTKPKCDGRAHRVTVSGANRGGESMPSRYVEYLFSQQGEDRVELVVKDLFERRSIDTLIAADTCRGLNLDPQLFTYDDYSIVGEQYVLKPDSVFVDNENPGWGATSRELLFKGVRSRYLKTVERYLDGLKAGGQSYILLPEVPRSDYDMTNIVKVVILTNRDRDLQYYEKIFGKGVEVELLKPL